MPPAVIDISAAGGDQVNPTTPIVVKVNGGKLTSVTVTNPRGKKVSGVLSSDGLSWQSHEDLGYDTDYDVDAVAVSNYGQNTEQHQTIHTLAPKAQASASFTPAPAGSVDVGVGQPIIVKFSRAIPDRAAAERALQVTSSPSQPGSWSWVSSSEVHYRPENYWQPGTKVTLRSKLYGVDLGSGVYGQSDQTLSLSVHDSWVAKADGNTEQMQVFHNGQFVKTIPVSMGKQETPTHVGPHVISEKDQKVTMDSCTYGVCPPDPKAYREDEFWDERISGDGEYVHENPATVAQQGATNVSHGCINLDEANAMWFFQTFGPGDVVEVTNSGGPPLPVTDLYGDWEIPWSQWKAGSALS